MDDLKSIAVPVTRKRSSPGKSRTPARPAPTAASTAVARAAPLRPSSAPARVDIHHRFHVGQSLKIRGGGHTWARAETLCRVVSLLPVEAGLLRYRVRSETENFERVVEEIDLTLPD